MFSSEKSQLLLEGRNREFYKLKNTVNNHVTLAGGQLHFEALQVRLCSVLRNSTVNGAVIENLILYNIYSIIKEYYGMRIL